MRVKWFFVKKQSLCDGYIQMLFQVSKHVRINNGFCVWLQRIQYSYFNPNKYSHTSPTLFFCCFFYPIRIRIRRFRVTLREKHTQATISGDIKAKANICLTCSLVFCFFFLFSFICGWLIFNVEANSCGRKKWLWPFTCVVAAKYTYNINENYGFNGSIRAF